MEERMDRKKLSVGKSEELDKQEREYWAQAPLEEKLRAITYLRECFYGREATTGRLQKVCTVFKRS